MAKLPALSGKDVLRALQRGGWVIARSSGTSHYVLKKEGVSNIVTVSPHGNKSLKKGTLHAIVKDSGFTEDEFLSLL